jgi:hypothetical protein
MTAAHPAPNEEREDERRTEEQRDDPPDDERLPAFAWTSAVRDGPVRPWHSACE